MGVLTSFGTPTFNGDGSCTIDGTDRFAAPASIFDEAQGCVVARVKPSWGSAAPPSLPRIYDANGKIIGYFSGGNWQNEYNGAAQVIHSVPQVFNAGDKITIGFKWKTDGANGLIKTSINGGGWSAGAAITTVAADAADFSIGNRASDAARPFTGDFFWLLHLAGDPTDADIAAIAAWDDAPTVQPWNVPANPKLLWPAVDLNYIENFARPEADSAFMTMSMG